MTKAKANVLAPAVLEIQIVSARKLKRMDKLKQNDVFCIISVPPPNPPIALTEDGADEREGWTSAKTSTIYSAQVRPPSESSSHGLFPYHPYF